MRKTASSADTRKFLSVEKSESGYDRFDRKLVEKGSVMEGMALAKQGEAATSLCD